MGVLTLHFYDTAPLNIYDKVYNIVCYSSQFSSLCSAILDAQNYTREHKNGINGLLADAKKMLNNFDLGEIIGQLNNFSPEQLDNLSELESLASALTERQKPNKAIEFPIVDGDA